MTGPSSGGWQPSYESVCQGLHVALGVLIAVLPAAVLGPSWGCATAGFFASLGFAAAKEFIFDTIWPPAWGGENDTWADSWDDFRHYLIGCYTGLGVVLVGIWLK